MVQNQALADPKPSLKILGASGGRLKNEDLTSIQVSPNCVIDAGNIVEGFEDNLLDIEHIFLTHTHLDHIIDIPFILDSTFEKRTKPLKIYAQKQNLVSLRKHIFNWDIWPDFTSIKMKNSEQFCVELIEIALNIPVMIENYTLTPIKTNHTHSSNGFVITNNDSSILFTSDTYCCDTILEKIDNDLSIKSIIIEVSFPSQYKELAQNSKHLTPQLLQKTLTKLKRDDITVFINHLKPSYQAQIIKEINEMNLLLNGGAILQKDDIIEF